MATKMRCPSCNFENRPGVKFCENCGKALQDQPPVSTPMGATCPACGVKNRTGVQYCENCGNKLVASPPTPVQSTLMRQICPACGLQNRAGVKFCENCGQAMEQPFSQPSGQPTQTPPGEAVSPTPGVDASDSAPASRRDVMRVRVRREGQRFQAEFLDIPDKPLINLVLPYEQEWESIQTQLEDWKNIQSFRLQAQVGDRLFQAILPAAQAGAGAKANQLFQSAWQEAWKEQKPLSVQIQFDADAVQAARMPWELLHDGTQHLALAEAVRVNRYVTYFGDRGPFEPVKELKILYVISRPTDQDRLPDYYARDAMLEALQPLINKGIVHIKVLEQSTLANLEAEVKSGDFHIVHYDGHRVFQDRQGYLCFETSNETSDLVTAAQLAKVLANTSVRLVFLSACQSAMVGGESVFGSVAPALIRERIPAVVAMQFSIPIGAAAELAEGFYQSLARGESIAAAVAMGRQAMHRKGLFSTTWFYPALYLRVADGEGYLFSGEPEAHTARRRLELEELARYWNQLAAWQQGLYSEGGLTWLGEPLIPPSVGNHTFHEPAAGNSPSIGREEHQERTASPADESAKPGSILPCQNRFTQLKDFLSKLGELEKGYNAELTAAQKRGDVDIFGNNAALIETYTKKIWSFLDTQKVDRKSKRWFIYPGGGHRIAKADTDEWGWEFSAQNLLDCIVEAEDDLPKWRQGIVPRNISVIKMGDVIQFNYQQGPEGLARSICDEVERYANALGLPT